MWYLAFMNEYDYKKEGVNVKIERETVISGLLLNGSIRNTASALGVSPSTIYRICNENGFKEEFDKDTFEGIEILGFEKNGSVANMIVKGDREEIEQKMSF